MMIDFTPELFTRFVKLRDEAVKEGKPFFIFQEEEVLVTYAGYVIEHLQTTMGYKGDTKSQEE